MTQRLNAELRSALRNLVTEAVDFPAEDKAEKTARKAMYAMLDNYLRRKYPQRDMKILQKYGQAEINTRLYRVGLPGDHVRFANPYQDDGARKAIPSSERHVTKALVPVNFGGCYDSLTEEEAKVYLWWETVRLAQSLKREEAHKDYYALISNAATLEQVEKVWPAAAKVRKSYVRNLPVAVLDDVLKRVAADQAARTGA